MTIAEEMAARDAVLRLLNLSVDRAPLPFGQKGHNLRLESSQTERLDCSQPRLSN